MNDDDIEKNYFKYQSYTEANHLANLLNHLKLNHLKISTFLHTSCLYFFN